MACRATLSARRASARRSARASVLVRAQSTKPDVKPKEKIYLGKGRFIEDDPQRYPAKDEWGTGGWAGGEQGLQRFVAQAELEESSQNQEAEAIAPSPNALGQGKDTVYVGKGQYIQDDARLYPSKEDAGPLTGSTGGFAGGERGLQHFIQTQSLEPAPPEVVRERQTRRDAFATVGVAAVAGASYVAYLFLTGQPLPEVPDVTALTSAPGQLSEAVSTGVPPVPGATPSFSVPSVSETEVKVVAAAALLVVGVVGGAKVVQKTKEVVEDTVDGAKAFAEANLVRLLVIGAAAAVYYVLLM